MDNNTMSKQLLNSLTAQITKLINENIDGIKVSFNGGNYDDTSATMKLKIELDNEDTKKAVEERVNRHARIVGVNKDVYGMSFSRKSSVYTIVDIDPKKHTYPVIAENQNGTVYKFPVSIINDMELYKIDA